MSKLTSFLKEHRLDAIIVLALIVGCLTARLPVLWPVSLMIWILAPGYLTLKALIGAQQRTSTTAILTFGLGLAMLILIALCVDSLHWVFKIQHPLTTNWLSGAIGTYCLLLVPRVRRLHPRLLRHPQLTPHFKPYRIGLIIWCITAIILTYFGVNLLNNTGNNTLISFAVIMVAVTPLIVVALRKRFTHADYAIVLFTMSFCTLIGSTLRSSSLFGSDIINEYRMFSLTAHSGFWSPTHINNTYNLCMSITVLPQALKALTGQDGLTIFRVVLQAIFSVCPIVIFLIGRRYMNAIKSFLAAVIFLSFENYIGSLPNHIRQEMAFLFFSLFIFVIINNELSFRVRKALLAIFGVAMILSHYSTSYVTLILLAAFMFMFYMFGILTRKLAVQRENNPLSIGMLVFFILFTVMWYSQLTATSGGPLAYVQQSVHNLFSNTQSLQASGTGLTDQFKLSQSSQTDVEAFTKLQEDPKHKLSYDAHYVPPPTSEGISNGFLNTILVNFTGGLKKIYKILTLLSVVGFGFVMYRKRSLRLLDVSLLGACVIAIAMSFILPSFTVDYDQQRFYQQLLVILSVPSVITWYILFGRRKVLATYALALFLCLYMLVSTGLSNQIIAGAPLSGKFSNAGTDYGRYYIANGDLRAATWATDNKGYRGVYADAYGSNRVRLVAPSFSPRETINPKDIPASSYIYLYSTNNLPGITFLQYSGAALTVNAPTDYYNTTSNKLYVNNKASIYEKETSY